MAASISITSNHSLIGFNVVVVFDSTHPIGTGTVVRVTDSGYTVVRGMSNLSYADYGPTYTVTDTEVGLDTSVTYIFIHAWGTGPTDYSSAVSSDNVLNTPSAGEFVLRSLFLPASTVIKDAEIGTLQDVSVNIRASSFSILGRPDPVVIVDTVDSEKSTLVIETKTATEASALSTLLRSASPLVLQSLLVYGVGSNGLLYFQPLSFEIKRVTRFGQEQPRRFEVSYVQVTPPIAATVFPGGSITYATTASTYSSYALMTSTVPTYFELLYGYASP